MSGTLPQPMVSFGTFEANPKAGELRKQGIRIKLHEKPLQVLLALLEHPGEVVIDVTSNPFHRTAHVE